jgi:hypothetical protein
MTKTTKTAKPAAKLTAKRVAKATTKVLDRKPALKPLTLDGKVVLPGRAPVTALGAIRQEIAAKAASKPVAPAKAAVATVKPAKAANGATASAKPAAEGVKAPTGAKGKIIAMIDASKAGVSAGEIAKALGWPRAGGTISRAIKLAPFKVAKARDAEGVLRYSRA